MSTTATVPLTFFARYHVPEEHRSELLDLAVEYAAAVESGEPNTHALGLYLKEDGSLFTHVLMVPSSLAMEEHLSQIREFLARAYKLVEPRLIEVFGRPGPLLRQALDNNAEAGAHVIIHDPGFAGFGRVSA